jgi:RHS repeat-associated protein
MKSHSLLSTDRLLHDSRGNIETIRYGPAAPVSPLLGWVYQYHLNGQRKNMRSTVTNLPGWTYTYNGRGEVLTTSKFAWNANMTSTAAVSGQLRSYQYDGQGNRLSVTRTLAAAWYTVFGGPQVRDDYGLNAANQYVSIAHSPPAVEVSGMRAVPGSRVTVNNLPVPRPGLHTNATTNESYQRNGEPGGFMYWLTHNAQANGALNYWPQVTVKTYNDSVSPPALVDAVSGRAYLRPAQENPVHDADGNLTQDAGWTYQWDGEGRMTGCQMRDVGLPLDVPLLRLAYVYDAQGRRAAKRVFAREINAAGTGREAAERLRSDWRYWYDGWNLMVEKDLVSGLVRQYVWGLDLSGSLGGAGGVGGLLGVRVGGKTYTACTETNGNIMGLIDGSTGVLAARWDYEAFGSTTTTVEAAGPFGHELCPFRFSSKYRDVETGLYYYGYRYYSPETGRWTSRDPIEEQGGINLYGMVGNDPVNRVDVLGTQNFHLKVFGAWPTKSLLPSSGKRFTPEHPSVSMGVLFGNFWGRNPNAKTTDILDITSIRPMRDIAKKVDKEQMKKYFEDTVSSHSALTWKEAGGAGSIQFVDAQDTEESSFAQLLTLRGWTLQMEMKCDQTMQSCGGTCKAKFKLYDEFDFKPNGLAGNLPFFVFEVLPSAVLTTFHITAEWEATYVFDAAFKISKVKNSLY